MSASDIVDRHSRFGTTSPMESNSHYILGGNDQTSMVSSNSARGADSSVPPAPPSSTSHQSSSVAGVAAGQRPDSSALPQTSPFRYQSVAAARGTPQDLSPRGESGVSAFSERERTHLRNLSDPATVSTMDGTITAAPSPPMGAQQQARFSSSSNMTTPIQRPIMEKGTLASLGNDKAQDTSANDDGDNDARRRETAVVSPPTAGDVDAEDYISARGSGNEELVSPVVARTESVAAPAERQPQQQLQQQPEGGTGSGRRSAFRESTEDI